MGVVIDQTAPFRQTSPTLTSKALNSKARRQRREEPRTPFDCVTILIGQKILQ